jgi:ATF/CREB family transcription factor
MSVGSAGSDEAQPPSRAPQKKPANGKRKAGDSSSKNGTTKKTKTARSASPPNMDSDDDDMMEMGEGSRGDEGDKGKMTEDEKRKNFLERNRYVCHVHIAQGRIADTMTESLLSSAANAKSNGWLICSTRSK